MDCMTAVKTVKIIESIPTPGKATCGLAWCQDAFWCFDRELNALLKVDLNGGIIKQHQLKNGCCDTAYDGTYIWQASPDNHQIMLINPENGNVEKTIETKDKCSGLCYNGTDYLRGSWTRKEVILFDPKTGHDIHAIPTGSPTSGLTCDGKNIWHGGEIEGMNYLFKVNRHKETFEMIPLNFTISGLTYDGTSLWAANSTENRFVKLEIA